VSAGSGKVVSATEAEAIPPVAGGEDRFFRLAIAADLSELPRVRERIDEVGSRAGLSDARRFDLQVAVSEAVANAIEHASSEVEAEAWVLPDRLIVEITNDGVFQPGLYKDNEARRRGLGLPLMVSLADQVHVSRLASGTTQVSLTFFRTPPAASSGDSAGVSAAREVIPPPLALWLLLAVFVSAITTLAALDLAQTYNPPGVFNAANIIFLTLTSLFVSVLAARSYLLGRAETVLFVGCGSLALGLGALLAAVHAGGPGAGPVPAAYNTAALLAGICYVGAALSVRWADSRRRWSRREVLVGSYVAILILLMILIVLIRTGMWPSHFVQGLGQTTLGSVIALASASLFALSAIGLVLSPRVFDAGLRRWFAIGLGLIAIGLAGVSLQLALGDPVNWVSRASQYGGSLVILTGLVLAARRTGAWVLPVERALRESETRYGNLVDLSPDGVLVHVKGKYVFANPAAARIFGALAPNELMGRDVLELVHPDYHELVAQRIGQALAGGISPPREINLVRLDGSHIEVEITGSRVEFGGSLGVQLVMHEITERKQAEAALRESEGRYRELYESALTGMFATSPEGRLLRANQALADVFGFESPEHMMSEVKNVAGLYASSSDREGVLRRIAEHENGTEEEVQIRRRDGTFGRIMLSTRPLRDGRGSVVGYEGGVYDVTERSRVEQALRTSDERFRSLFENMQEALFVYELVKNEDGRLVDVRYVEVNRAAERFLNRSRDELIGRTSVEILGGSPTQTFLNVVGRVARTGAPAHLVEFSARLGRWYESFFYRPQPGQVAMNLIDITDSKQAEEALRRSEKQHRLMAAENERLYRQQLAIAENLQGALLHIPSELGPVRIGHLYRSATQAARIGGDFYDVFEVKDGRIAVLIGDVAGHGIEAARVAALTKDVIHAFAHQTLQPNQVLRRANALLLEKALSGFVTAFLGILDPWGGNLTYASAGHPDTLLRRASGDIDTLGGGSSPLGVYADASWKRGDVGIGVGEMLLLYTDGVIEARRGGEFFGEKRLQAVLKRKRLSVERLPSQVLDRVLAFSGGTLQDDVAILSVLYTGDGASSTPAVDAPSGKTRWIKT